MSGKDDFLSRWSRRKRDRTTEPRKSDEPTVAVPEPDADAAHPDHADDRSDEEILAGLGLKHPDEFVTGDDIKGFMQAAVPDRLRRLALRQLWRANPVLANLDGLIDYGEDYTDAAMVVENVQTLYQVGKGMLRDLAEDEEEPVVEGHPEIPTRVSEASGAADPAEAIVQLSPPRYEPANAQDSLDAVEKEDADEPLDIARTRKRMAFRFAED